MNDGVNEKRSEGRLLTRLGISAKIVSTPAPALKEGDEIECITRDISFTGVCLLIKVNLPANSKLIIKVEDRKSGITYNHMGEITWVRQQNGDYLAGFHIFEHLCDEPEWRNLVINLLSG